MQMQCDRIWVELAQPEQGVSGLHELGYVDTGLFCLFGQKGTWFFHTGRAARDTVAERWQELVCEVHYYSDAESPLSSIPAVRSPVTLRHDKGVSMDTTLSLTKAWSAKENLGTVPPFPDFRVERDTADIQTALQQKDMITLVRILSNRNNDQRQILATVYQHQTEKDLNAGLKKVLSGDLESLMLCLMMPSEQFEAHRLRKAMEGLGTDEETLLEILCTRTPQQLSNIKAAYNKEYERDLEKDLISETSGDFTRLLVALLKKKHEPGLLEQDVMALSEELDGKKANADVWIRVLTTRSLPHLRNVLIYLKAEKGQSISTIIEKHFGGILSGDFRLGLQTLVRCIENSDLYLAQRIQTMKWEVLQGVMVSHSEEDLLAIRVAFKRETGTSLYTTLTKQFSGALQQALLAICRAED